MFVGECENNGRSNSSWNFTAEKNVWNMDKQTDADLYQQIIFNVLRKPKQLISHVQRIYLTYNQGMIDQLYAALIDMLWVLDGKGSRLSIRMIAGTQHILTQSQINFLSLYLEKQDISLLVGNKFSALFSRTMGTHILVVEQGNEKTELDPLTIAHDYIEYSQLDAAIESLEHAIFKFPERVDLQNELLGLYKVTNNIDKFKQIYHTLTVSEFNLSTGWQELTDYFSGQTNE